jgi:hypothetical protein
MPDRTAAYWEEKAARAIETASTATTTELRLAFLGIAKNYSLVRRICGRRQVLAACQACDTARFP